MGGQTQSHEGGVSGQSEPPIGGLAGESLGGGDGVNDNGAGGNGVGGSEGGNSSQGGHPTSDGGESANCRELPVISPGAAGAGLCSSTYQFVLGGPPLGQACIVRCFDWEEQLDCEEGCLCESGCDDAPEQTYAIYTCRALEPVLEFGIGNPPPGNASCESVSCPQGYSVKSCENWCAENPDCEASGETWYAHLVCEICPP
jgi:hypothetical protein